MKENDKQRHQKRMREKFFQCYNAGISDISNNNLINGWDWTCK